MNFELPAEFLKYIEDTKYETLKLLETICKIPAPSNYEEKRAKFCKKWLMENGANGVIIDDALNVVYPMNCDNCDDIIVFMAHTDTVFPDMTEPMPYHTDEDNIYSPGVGDDTICLVMMLMTIKYIVKNNLSPKQGILFVANSGEEGLGNLKGVKQIMSDYEGRIKRLYTFDATYDEIICKCVGSHRYKISIKTEGGHSFNNFGNENAIVIAAELICRLNKCVIPKENDSKTTYNVGVIEGGTSVNTIAQNASFMYEYRSDSAACIDKMKQFFESEIKNIQNCYNAKINVETVGIRPCASNVDEALLEEMIQQAQIICEKHSNIICKRESGSTDANIPMSLGVPAICVGTYLGKGAHTREEYIVKSSILTGLKIVGEIILRYL